MATLRPDVIERVLVHSLGRWIADGGQDRLARVNRAGTAFRIAGPKQTESLVLIEGTVDADEILEPIRSGIPGQPAPTLWAHRGVTLKTLTTARGRAFTVSDFPDGIVLVADHPGNLQGLIRETVGVLGNPSSGYQQTHGGALESDALIALHVTNPNSLSSVPGMQDIPWEHLVTIRGSLKRSGTALELVLDMKATSMIKARIIYPFLEGMVNRAADNPDVAPPLRTLLKRIQFGISWSTITASVSASVLEIEDLLLYFTRSQEI